MVVYKFEFLKDSHRNREWVDPIATHVEYYKENNLENREKFSEIVGERDVNFINLGFEQKYLGYKITEIKVH